MKKRHGEATLEKATRGKIAQHQIASLGTSPAGISAFYKSIPNILTILRLLGTPLILWLVAQGVFTTAFLVFFTVCLTDWLDGYLARQWQVTSKLGQILDPLADKFLLMSLYLALALWEFIPVWLTIFVLTRDVLILTISGGIILFQKVKIPLAPQFIGKLSTTLQMLFIGLILAHEVPLSSIPPSSIKGIVMVSCLYSVALTTVLSGIAYARMAFKAFRNQ
ncbi:MAG: hypothetical protein K0R76_1647 [Alphaproteobacteria bacterium]|jgi:cardiolipin synthase|nr:hypothetical protein [Alphaproteobacteria bacterium]